jgi:hypothetical protein
VNSKRSMPPMASGRIWVYFSPLKKLVLQLYAWLGLELQDKGEQGMYVNIPMTPDTVPSIAEQIEFKRTAEEHKPL